MVATFVFADIAGFTALTEAHGDEEAAGLAGDAVMLALPDPRDAVLLGLRITHELSGGHAAPGVRVGMHHGSAVERDGDFFGAAVNLAARVSAQAVAGEVLMTAATAALAADLDEVVYESRGRQQLRNVRDPVELVAAVRVGETARRGLPVDPVCQMAVDPEHAAGRLVYEDTAYFFCSLECAGAFARRPETYAR